MNTTFDFIAMTDVPKFVRKWNSLIDNHTSKSFPKLFVCKRNEELGRHNYLSNPYQLVCTWMHKDLYPNIGFETSTLLDESKVSVTRTRCRLREKRKGQTKPQKDDLIFFTACRIKQTDKEQFLNQFTIASRYMTECIGFVCYRLYEALSEESPFNFVNVAQWRSKKEFIDAFQNAEFKNKIRGGFDVQSHIIVAQESCK